MPLLYLSVSGASADCLTRLPFPEHCNAGDARGRKREKNQNQASLFSVESGTCCETLLHPVTSSYRTPLRSQLPGVLTLCLNIVQSSQTQHMSFVPLWPVGLHQLSRTEKKKQNKKRQTLREFPLFFPLLLLHPHSPSDPGAAGASTWAGATGSTQPLIFMDTGIWKGQNQTHQTSIIPSQSQTVRWINSTLTPGHLQYFIPGVILGWT